MLLQDTFLTVLLSLPPNATHTDVSVDDLTEDDSSIASDNPADTAYIRGSWTLANLVQRSICSPRSLDVPICMNPRQKSKLVGEFKTVYRSFPDAYRSWDAASLGELAKVNKRGVLQTLFLSSNYHHNLMLVHASESDEGEVHARCILEAAHEAIKAFFVLYSLFEAEARVWWVFNHRAFLEALCIGNVLREEAEKKGREALLKDPVYNKPRDDIREFERSLLPTSPPLAFQLSLSLLHPQLTHVGRPHDTDHAGHERGTAGFGDGQDSSAGAERPSALGRGAPRRRPVRRDS